MSWDNLKSAINLKEETKELLKGLEKYPLLRVGVGLVFPIGFILGLLKLIWNNVYLAAIIVPLIIIAVMYLSHLQVKLTKYERREKIDGIKKARGR